MKRRLRKLFATILFSWFLALPYSILCPIITAAAPGQTALDFLNLPIGAYSASLGRGGYAGIFGPEAIFLNPGQLGERTGAFASHQELLLDTRTEAFAAAIKIKYGLTLGGAAYFLDNGKIEGYSPNNIKTGEIDSGDRLLRLALAAHHRNISLGLSISQYHQQLAELNGNGWGFGAGASFSSRLGNFAMTLDNIGPRFKIGNSSAPLPGRFVISAWLPFHNNMVNLNLDLIVRRSQKTAMAAGLEYRFTNALILRGGSGSVDPISLGFRLASGKIAFDYSYIPGNTFGGRHILSASFLK